MLKLPTVSVLVSLLFAFLVLASSLSHANVAAPPPPEFSKERALYQQALQSLKRGQLTSFRRTTQQLTHYPLYPYLLHKDLERRLYTLPNKAIQSFVSDYPDLPVTRKLHKKWLMTLGKNKRWTEFERYYTPQTTSDALDCYYYRAQLASGKQQEAWRGAQKLWLSGASRPDSCDPLFKAWHSSGQLTAELVWQRINLAYSHRNSLLGRYLIRFLPASQQGLGNLYRAVYRNPEHLEKMADFSSTDLKTQDIIYTGLQRLSYRDPEKALALWNRYRTSHHFDDAQTRYLNERISLYLLKQFKYTQLSWAETIAGQKDNPLLVEWRIRLALRTQDWQSVLEWIDALPIGLKSEPRWVYWKIRAEESLSSLPEPVSFSTRYQALANMRDYYGFLSASHIGSSYAITNIPNHTDNILLTRVANLPAIRRAYEFYQLNDLTSARREWNHLSSTSSVQQKMAAAQIAHDWNWYNQSIRSTISARQWDDLNLRFPLAFKDKILRSSQQQKIDSSWLFAIARQESAFMHDARSSAGALGLLQLMPTTARQVAKQSKTRYRGKRDLLNPTTNIHLGSTYLAQLLKRFKGNRVLATAAYNAGPHRVNQWLKDDAHLPFDVWIETIPFKETRQYVQNVLSYSVIYSEKLGISPRMLSIEEINGNYSIN